jgi:lipid A 4'-phosphatase
MINKALFLLVFTLLAIIFYQYSELDLIVSNYFYRKEIGFYLQKSWFALFIHKIVPVIVVTFIVWSVVLGMRKLLRVKSVDPRHYIKIIYIMLVCITGPGLVVNVIFKDHFGRARPVQIKEFGGNADFTPAFVISNQCDVNCSFVSGHASIGFVFFAFAFINHARKRVFYIITGLTLGMLFGLGRIIQGAHFLSDVIFSGFFVYMTAYLLAKLILPWEINRTEDNIILGSMNKLN